MKTKPYFGRSNEAASGERKFRCVFEHPGCAVVLYGQCKDDPTCRCRGCKRTWWRSDLGVDGRCPICLSANIEEVPQI
jgi:hypothetical protein